MPLDLATSAQQLITNPKQLMRKIPIQIHGQASGVQTFYVCDALSPPNANRPGKYLGNLKRHAAPDGLNIWNVPIGVPIQSYCVGMFNYNAGIQPMIVPSPGAAAQNLILTGQLTDCVFSIGRMPDGSLTCSHTRPIGVVGGGGALYGLVAAAFGGHFCYGPDHGYTNGAHTVSIVGVVEDGEWVFYAQRRQRGGAESIIDTKKIFPN